MNVQEELIRLRKLVEEVSDDGTVIDVPHDVEEEIENPEKNPSCVATTSSSSSQFAQPHRLQSAVQGDKYSYS